jgi:hypothetical protein
VALLLRAKDHGLCYLPLFQVAVQPGLEDVLTDLLEYEADAATGAEFYIEAFPQLDGGWMQDMATLGRYT